jgi:hypothetical protein
MGFTMGSAEELLAEPRRRLSVVERLLNELGLAFTPIPDAPVGVGVAVAWPSGFLVISAPAGSTPTVYVTGGVLRDVEPVELPLLQECNERNAMNPAYCFFLHEADSGWDVIVQHSHLLQIFVDAPAFLQALLEPTLAAIAEARPKFTQRGAGGWPYLWDEENRHRLLYRSLI